MPLFIVLAGIAAYHNSFQGVFVYDDGYTIVTNERIRQLWPPWTALGGTSRPLVQLSLALNYALGELNPWGYHLFNLVVHLLAGLTLYGVVKRTLVRLSRASELQSFRALETTDIVGQAHRLAKSSDGEPAASGAPALQLVDGTDGREQARGYSDQAAATLAGVIALIWVVHPLNTQAVTYIIQRGESMMGLFYLLTLYCFIRDADTEDYRLTTDDYRPDAAVRCSGTTSAVTGIVGQAPRLAGLYVQETAATGAVALQSSVSGLWSLVSGLRHRRAFWLTVSILFCALGMVTKPIMASAPVVLLLYDRLFISHSWHIIARRRHWYYGALCLTWLGMALSLPMGKHEWHGSAGYSGHSVSALDYALSQPSVILHYLTLVVWPAGLCFDYLWSPSHSAWQNMPPLLIVCGAILLTIHFTCRGRPAAFTGIWFFGVLSLSSSFIPIADLVMEHRMYLPMAAPLSLFIIGGHAILQASSIRPSSWLVWLLLSGVIISLAISTRMRNNIYHTVDRSLSDVVDKRPLNYRMHVLLAYHAMSRDDHSTAQEHFRSAVTISQYHPQHHQRARHLGPCYFYLRDYNNAHTYLTQALAINPNDARCANLLGLIHYRRGAYEEAVALFAIASQKDPLTLEHHFNHGLTLFHLNRYLEAEQAFRQAVSVKPSDGPSLHGLAMASWRQGKVNDAVAAWKRVTVDNSDKWVACYNLAWIYSTHPDDRVRNGTEALQLAEQIAADLKNPSALALEVLAAAYAENGRFAEAADAAERAITLPIDTAGTVVPMGGREMRLKLYREDKPYRMVINDEHDQAPAER
jgi:tetratricopeptide (TPR) repeat protein